jgi:hypothetical protein
LEGGYIFTALIRCAHLPTVLISIGYLVYWAELYWLNRHNGTTTPLASVLFVIAAVVFLKYEKTPKAFADQKISWRNDSVISKLFWITGAVLCMVILFFGFIASVYPPHLIQESDTLMYHIMLPRQHLLWGTFKHLSWSAADLLMIPLDYALAPFWLATALPNKFPQFLILAGLVLVSCRLASFFNQDLRLCLLTGITVIASHHVGIQAGTAMMDLAACYLFLAALESLLAGRILFFVIEFTFFFWSKSFIPVQMGFILAGMIALWFIARFFKRAGLELSFEQALPQKLRDALQRQWKKMLALFFILSLLIGAPFFVKAIYYSGTPFYPIGQGLTRINSNIDPQSDHWLSIERHARYEIEVVKEAYGYGRGLRAFLKHVWLIAVPEKDVNNSYDYPLGLIYLLAVGPFVVFLISSLYRKKWPVLPLFIVFYWLSWWLGSHQSRFLFIPVLLMVILVISKVKKPSLILHGAILFALLSTTFSVIRAHKSYFGKPFAEVLRKKDKMLLEINGQYIKNKVKGPVVLNFHDVAYATFPVVVQPEARPFTLAL